MADGGDFITPHTRQGAAGEVVSYESFFTAKAAAQAQVFLQLETMRTAVAFDNASVREVFAATPAAKADWAALASAPADATRQVGCAEPRWPQGCAAVNLDGQAVALPMNLPAGTQ